MTIREADRIAVAAPGTYRPPEESGSVERSMQRELRRLTWNPEYRPELHAHQADREEEKRWERG